jgi:hypothetical protein
MTRDQIVTRIEETEALIERALEELHTRSFVELYAAGEEIDRLRFVLLNLQGMLEDLVDETVLELGLVSTV